MNERTGIFTDTKKELKLDGIIDLNLGLEYRYSGTVALFLNINNLTSIGHASILHRKLAEAAKAQE
jgi:hypothetical protein